MSGLIAVLGFFFWIGGGFDLFKPPVEVVIPAVYSGVVCAKSLPSPPAAPTNRYEVLPNGFLPIDTDTLQSHRRWRFLSKESGTGTVTPLPNDAMSPRFGETDMQTNSYYAVFWVGTPNSWSQFIASQAGKPVCIGRF